MDIYEEKNATKAIKTEGLMIALDNILKNLPGHIFWKDKNGVYLGCNDLQATDLGFVSREEIIGKTDADIHLQIEQITLFLHAYLRHLEK